MLEQSGQGRKMTMTQLLSTPRTSMEVFEKYVRHHADGSADASRIMSKDCFQEWVASRKKKLKNPCLTFVHTLRSHVTGDPKTGRNPFPAAVEASLLKHFRNPHVWPCFQGEGVRYGSRGMFVTGYHEARSGGGNVSSGSQQPPSSTTPANTTSPRRRTPRRSSSSATAAASKPAVPRRVSPRNRSPRMAEIIKQEAAPLETVSAHDPLVVPIIEPPATTPAQAPPSTSNHGTKGARTSTGTSNERVSTSLPFCETSDKNSLTPRVKPVGTPPQTREELELMCSIEPAHTSRRCETWEPVAREWPYFAEPETTSTLEPQNASFVPAPSAEALSAAPPENAPDLSNAASKLVQRKESFSLFTERDNDMDDLVNLLLPTDTHEPIGWSLPKPCRLKRAASSTLSWFFDEPKRPKLQL